MTVFRVNVDRDEAEVVQAPEIWRHDVGNNNKGKVQSLSEVSYQLYSTWRYWPILWRANYLSFPDFNPNKTKRRMKILAPRASKITQLDRVWCDRIWLNWDNIKKADEHLATWQDEQDIQDPELSTLFGNLVWQSLMSQPAGIVTSTVP